MNLKYIILCLFILPFLAWGQGFKGKTLSLSPHFSGSYTGPGDYIDINALAVNFDIEKTFNRSFSIGISGFRMLTTEDFYVGSSTRRNNFVGSGFGLFFRRYILLKGSIAPLGPFVELGFARNAYDVSDANEVFVAKIATAATTLTLGFNWFLGKNLLFFGGIEGKYEAPLSNIELDENLVSRFGDDILETFPVNVKLGITIPIL